MDAGARLTARKSAPPAAPRGEVIEIRAADGHALGATVREPARGLAVHGVAILAHAMFARRSEWERASFAEFLQERGWRTIAFDFRGHGDSGPGAAQGGSWSYGDLVSLDLPAVVSGARARAKKGRVIVLGHSLGGHVAAAAQATGAIDVDGIGLIAANVWLRACEPSVTRWAAKLGTIGVIDAIVRRAGRFPARVLRQGSDDESAAYMRDLVRVAREQWWGTRDGKVDYWDALRNVRVPLFALASAGDTINCAPECAARFALRAAGRVTFEEVTTADDGGPPPGHMELVTTPRAQRTWITLERWMRG